MVGWPAHSIASCTIVPVSVPAFGIFLVIHNVVSSFARSVQGQCRVRQFIHQRLSSFPFTKTCTSSLCFVVCEPRWFPVASYFAFPGTLLWFLWVCCCVDLLPLPLYISFISNVMLCRRLPTDSATFCGFAWIGDILDFASCKSARCEPIQRGYSSTITGVAISYTVHTLCNLFCNRMFCKINRSFWTGDKERLWASLSQITFEKKSRFADLQMRIDE